MKYSLLKSISLLSIIFSILLFPNFAMSKTKTVYAITDEGVQIIINQDGTWENAYSGKSTIEGKFQVISSSSERNPLDFRIPEKDIEEKLKYISISKGSLDKTFNITLISDNNKIFFEVKDIKLEGGRLFFFYPLGDLFGKMGCLAYDIFFEEDKLILDTVSKGRVLSCTNYRVILKKI